MFFWGYDDGRGDLKKGVTLNQVLGEGYQTSYNQTTPANPYSLQGIHCPKLETSTS